MIFISQRTFYQSEDPTVAHTNGYRLRVEDTPQPILSRLLSLPETNLLTGRPPVALEPLAPGHARLYHARHVQVASDAALNTLKAFGLSLVGAAVLTGVCVASAPLLGASAVAVHVTATTALIAAFARVALRERVMADAVRGTFLLASAYDDLSNTPADEEMAQLFMQRGREAMVKAQVLGIVDERVLAAANQYALAFNEKFEDPFLLL